MDFASYRFKWNQKSQVLSPHCRNGASQRTELFFSCNSVCCVFPVKTGAVGMWSIAGYLFIVILEMVLSVGSLGWLESVCVLLPPHIHMVAIIFTPLPLPLPEWFHVNTLGKILWTCETLVTEDAYNNNLKKKSPNSDLTCWLIKPLQFLSV